MLRKRIGSLFLALCVLASLTSNAFAASRATSIPTTYAPSSWYETWHTCTAREYTYSSYIFPKGTYFSFSTFQPAYPVICSVDGKHTERLDPMWYDFYYAAYAQPDYDYYVIIYNDRADGKPITATDQCQYQVSKVGFNN